MIEINDEFTVETALERMDEIRGIIERGDITLNESVKLFEEASNLYTFCNKKLAEIDDRVKILAKNAQGKLEPTVFEYDE